MSHVSQKLNELRRFSKVKVWQNLIFFKSSNVNISLKFCASLRVVKTCLWFRKHNFSPDVVPQNMREILPNRLSNWSNNLYIFMLPKTMDLLSAKFCISYLHLGKNKSCVKQSVFIAVLGVPAAWNRIGLRRQLLTKPPVLILTAALWTMDVLVCLHRTSNIILVFISYLWFNQLDSFLNSVLDTMQLKK